MSQIVFRYLFRAPPRRPITSLRLPLASLSIGTVLSGLAAGRDARTSTQNSEP
jgi:hypothetical protein